MGLTAAVSGGVRIKGEAGEPESKLPLYNLAALGLNLPEGQGNAEFLWLFSG